MLPIKYRKLELQFRRQWQNTIDDELKASDLNDSATAAQ